MDADHPVSGVLLPRRSTTKAAKAALRTERLNAVADRGYFNGEEILACDQAGVAVTLRKPMTSGAKAKDASASRTSSTSRRRTSIAARPAKP